MKITVCIATYNGGRFIHEQLASILPQLSEGDEVIVSDDGSTDNTLDVVRGFDDSRIKIILHQKRKAKFTIDYATANFENALKHSSGDVIFLSDQDDVWMPTKVSTMLAALEGNDIVMSDCTVVDSKLNVLHPSYSATFVPFTTSIFKNFLKCSFLGSCMALRRPVLERALPFPPHGVGHDLWLGLIGLRYFHFKYIPEPQMKYRRHDETVTMGGKDNATTLWFKISYRLYILKAMMLLLK